MKSIDSCNTAAADRCGLPDVFQISSFGWTWAFFFASLNGPLFGVAPDGSVAAASPPWQSVQPIALAFVCIDGLSGLWHVRQPALLRATSASLCCRGTCGADCGAAATCAGTRPTLTGPCPAAGTDTALRATSDVPSTGSHPIAKRIAANRHEAAN